MSLGIYPNLTKDYILQRISQEQIMEHYLGIPVKLDVLLLSPLRNDNNPTCAFYYNQHGRLRFRDLSGHFWGDCFDVVAFRLNLKTNDKKSFNLILHTIAKDFRIHKYTDVKEVIIYDKITKDYFSKKKAKNKLIIRVIPREYNYHDLSYWKKFNIDLNILNHGKVYCAEEIWISRDNINFTKIYRYSTKDPAYCYFGDKDIYGRENWKIYYPFRKKPLEKTDPPRFHSNSSFLQGKHLITGGTVGIITKAYKDVLAFRSIGLQAVAPSAESVLLSKSDFKFMKDKFKYLISCMDFDRAGIRMSWLLRETYNIPAFMFTDGRFNTYNYEVKDFAEYIDKYGKDSTIKLVKNIYNKNIN